MLKKISIFTFLGLTAFYSVPVIAQPGAPRSIEGRPQTDRGPQRGPQPQGRPDARSEADRMLELTKRAVEAGKMTREQAMQRYNAWRQRQGLDRMQPDRPQPQGRPASRPDDASSDIRAEGGRIWMELRKAVEAGDITREQAVERFSQWRTRQAQNRPNSPATRNDRD
ncbi:MAG: hypothetical protein CMJ76_16235 [Planctomycetaceae bacterium]|nr:hypothetical protein [Planctomycetaceae bacterium]|tara:strand:+ start:304 stop:807 length:504 start_codon:yes stop_codon:yes gene_type:complete